MAFAGAELTRDGFLGGALIIRQPKAGYRAGVDPVFLAAAVPAGAGQSVLELGCGAGVASLCLGRRVPGLLLTGLELQDDYADLACRNAAENGIALDVVKGDVAAMPSALRARRFDHVIANPPYYRRGSGTPARDPGREAALGESVALDVWVGAALKRLAPGGWLTLIQRADRLPDLLTALGGGAGVTVLPLAPRVGRDAALVIVQARRGGRAAFRLLAPVVLHEGARHLADGDDYAPEARAVLREGAPWSALVG